MFLNHYHTIPLPWAERIADVLTEYAGANLGPDRRLDRIYSFGAYLGECNRAEYRFCGSLGFGGKFRNQGNGWRIDCYYEDSTLEREGTVFATNWALACLYYQFLEELTSPTL